jgi:hypothetical protein
VFIFRTLVFPRKNRVFRSENEFLAAAERIKAYTAFAFKVFKGLGIIKLELKKKIKIEVKLKVV